MLSDSTNPPAYVMAYFVGGPWDDTQVMVDPRIRTYMATVWDRGGYEFHAYAPCSETGEWLWVGQRHL